MVLGKTDVPRALADCQAYNDIYGTTHNPWDLGRPPGGGATPSAFDSSSGRVGGLAYWEHTMNLAGQALLEQDRRERASRFRQVVRAAGLDPKQWTRRELRRSFVSLLSDSGVTVEKISVLVGHNGTRVTELVYRQQLRPVIQDGAATMDSIFPSS